MGCGCDRISDMMQVVSINAKVQGGVPCFAGTRIPISSLFDHLKKGYTVDEFLEANAPKHAVPTAGE
jgi:uncharacterized protein (DUF433 family)